MKITTLLKNVSFVEIIGDDVNIKHISNKSTSCKKQSLFFCIIGVDHKGSDYLDEAIQNGAVAVVTSKKIKTNITQIVVQNVRSDMAIIAGNFYNNPSKKLKVIGITGTNGKTTSSFIIKNILEVAGFKVCIIGTNGVFIDNKLINQELTTPDPIELNQYFNQMIKQNLDYCIMEVSAHAIALNKIEGIYFRVGMFTNLTNEHLDFFGNMKNYAKCKMSFFDPKHMQEAVVNVDETYGREIAKRNAIPCVSYGVYNPCNSFAIKIETSLQGSQFFANVLDSLMDIKTNLIGEHNVYNILGAMSVCKLLSIRDEIIEKGVENCPEIDGRFNVIKLNNNNHIIIDFAHTPDGFEKILSLLRRLVKGKLVTLFGCVEYSDTKKRTLMGKIARMYSDYILLTADNPNNTSVLKINKDIKAGFKKFKNYTEFENRCEAITYGIGMLCKNDALVLLGKGGENKQVLFGEKTPYNEREIVNNLLNN